MSELIVRTPEVIAIEINGIKEQTRKMLIYNSIEIGRRLVEAKELVGHGEWGRWLKEEVDYSKSTANNLMKIFKEYGADQISLVGDNLKSQTFGELTYSQAVLLLSVPGEEREKFVKENKIDDMSTRELKKAIKDRDEALKELNKVKEESEQILKEKEILEEAFNSGADERRIIEEEKEQLFKEKIRLEKLLEEERKNNTELNVETTDLEIEYKEKLDELKKKNEFLEKKLDEAENLKSESAAKFKIHFDSIVNSFSKLLQELATMESENEAQYIKYNGAAKKFINTMLERL